MNAAIFYLTQNTEVRRVYLKTSLYFLFKNFNDKFKYPVVIFHEGDYDTVAQTDIIMSIRASCRSLVSFRALDAGDFKIPDHIDKERLKACIDTKATSYWRNEKYRMMCRWWIIHFPRYAKNYDYVMRLDDDSIIEETIKSDLFSWMGEKKLVYTSNFVHMDCGICCYGMKEFFMKHFKNESDHKKLDKIFVTQELNMQSYLLFPFRKLLSINEKPLPEPSDKFKIDSPLIYYNNFFITKTAFWLKPEVQKIIEEIDKNGSIFYYRWGDAPIQSMIVLLLAKESEVDRCIFKYSKRMQREAFYGDDKVYHSFMPERYDQSSCITEEKQN